jgi:NADPH:quinone reductase-like Zn-dependent oxidoreductase
MFLKASEACAKGGKSFGIGLGQTSDSEDFAGGLFKSYGADLVNAKGDITLNTDAVKQVLEYGQKFVKTLGDDVVAYARKDVVHGGTFAELVTMSVRGVAHKSAALSWDEAGGLPLSGLTALQTLDRLAVSASDTVLVHGGAGGVGSLAVQIARARGARVIATASPSNHDFLCDLGATPVAYGDGVVERIREVAPDGVDVVADFVGGVRAVTMAVLAVGGRHASIADSTVLETGGSWFWVRPSAEGLAELGRMADAGQLRVPVADVLPLEELPAAFARSRAGQVRGKLVISVSD